MKGVERGGQKRALSAALASHFVRSLQTSGGVANARVLEQIPQAQKDITVPTLDFEERRGFEKRGLEKRRGFAKKGAPYRRGRRKNPVPNPLQ